MLGNVLERAGGVEVGVRVEDRGRLLGVGAGGAGVCDAGTVHVGQGRDSCLGVRAPRRRRGPRSLRCAGKPLRRLRRRSASRPGKQESEGGACAVHRRQRTIAAIVGEFDLIARLAAALGDPGPDVMVPIGDDAALLAPDLIVSTDLLVEDVHVRRATSGPADIGWKALAAAVSDLAAMGAEPVGAVIGLALGAGWTPDEAVAVYEGVAACAAACRCPVVGGDVTRAPVLMLAVTVLGRAAAPATRAGARPGDVLAVTGVLGGSEAGRLVLEGVVPPPPEEGTLA